MFSIDNLNCRSFFTRLLVDFVEPLDSEVVRHQTTFFVYVHNKWYFDWQPAETTTGVSNEKSQKLADALKAAASIAAELADQHSKKQVAVV